MTTGYGDYDPNYKPTKREHEICRENMRNAFGGNDLWTNARLMDSEVMLRHVDEDALTKCRLSFYGKRKDAITHSYNFAEEAAIVDKTRDASVSASKLETRLDPREIPLEESLEMVYFKTFGEDSHGNPVPDKPDGGYNCPCGLRMRMPWKVMPLECPTCRRRTPVGKLVDEGVLHR